MFDQGTGPGLWLHYIEPFINAETRVSAADLSMKMIHAARNGIGDPDGLVESSEFSIDLPTMPDPDSFLDRVLLVRADAERPPFSEDTFDSYVSFQAPQYTNQRTSIAQLLRFTRPGGRVVVGTRPGSEVCGYLEYDRIPDQVKDPKKRNDLRRQSEGFDRFLSWFEEEYPRQAVLFREGWTATEPDPLQLYTGRERGKISQCDFQAQIDEWEGRMKRAIDQGKNSCIYGEKRFADMVQRTAKDNGSKVLEVETKSIPVEEAIELDAQRAQKIDLDDSWDQAV